MEKCGLLPAVYFSSLPLEGLFGTKDNSFSYSILVFMLPESPNSSKSSQSRNELHLQFYVLRTINTITSKLFQLNKFIN